MSSNTNHPIRRAWRYAFDRGIIFVDAVTIFGGGLTTWYILRNNYNGPVLSLNSTLPLLIYFTGILLLIGVLIGLYRAPFYRNARYQLILLAKTYSYGAIAIIAAFYFFRVLFVPRSYTLLFMIVAPFHVWIGRSVMLMAQRSLVKWGMGHLNVLMVSDDHNGAIERDVGYEWLAELGYDLRGFVSIGNGHAEKLPANGNYPEYQLDEMEQVVEREGIDRIFITSTSFVVKGLHEIVAIGNVKVVAPEATRLLKTSRVYDVAGITIYTPPRPIQEATLRILKRTFDLINSVLIIILLSPVYLFAALAIFIESGRPVIYSQKRAAIKGGPEFNFFKFRSMVRDADKLREELSQQNESSGPLFKMKNDPRLTRVGRFLRRYSIDELPQIFNVLKGDMSLVGPRPLPVTDLEKVGYSDEIWGALSDRARTKPGITGLWQISGRSNIKFNEMVLLDLYYVEHQSLAFDLEILFETIPAVLFGRGAY